jgi:hypothetical protein
MGTAMHTKPRCFGGFMTSNATIGVWLCGNPPRWQGRIRVTYHDPIPPPIFGRGIAVYVISWIGRQRGDLHARMPSNWVRRFLLCSHSFRAAMTLWVGPAALGLAIDRPFLQVGTCRFGHCLRVDVYV